MRKWITRLFEWLRNFEWISSLLELGRERGFAMLGEVGVFVAWLWDSPAVPVLCVLAFGATVGQWAWARKGRNGHGKQPADLLPMKLAVAHVVRTSLDPGEAITKDALAEAFLVVCKLAENDRLALKGRLRSRFAPIHDIDAGMIKLCIPEAETCTLNVRNPDNEGIARQPDGKPCGYKRLYVSKAEMLALWPDA